MNVLQATVGNRSYPPDTGGYQRTHGLICSFPDFGDTVHRYCCTGPAATYYTEGEFIQRKRQIEPNLTEERHYSLLHDVPKGFSILGYPGVAWPAVFKTWAGSQLLDRAAESDVAIADNPYLALFLAENTAVPTVYSSHNIEYQRYLSTAERPFSDAFGAHLRQAEERACERADLVVCTTETDRSEFATHAHSTAVVPNGIATEKLTAQPEPASKAMFGIPDDATVATFLGSDYGPNVEAARWLTDNWDRLDDHHHLLIVGDSGDDIESDASNVHTAGYVEDLSATLAMADVALNPMFSGGGSNVKLIEYFAAGLPVVSTPFGARGFEVTDDEHLCLAEQERFFDALGRLCDDSQRRVTLGAAGRELAADRYTWESLSEQFRQTLRESLPLAP